MGRGVAEQVGFQPGRDDQAGLLGQQRVREIGVDGEEQGVGEVAVIGPFLVGEEVARADLISMHMKSPSGRRARMSARRPLGRGTSCSSGAMSICT